MLTRDKLAVGHWYGGDKGVPRRIVAFNQVGVGYEVIYVVPGKARERVCWCSSFEAWAVRDLGPELPKEQG